ncbi:MAG: hypothetical protein ABJA67_10955, partial [Chthonomonadales bacterium]
MNSKPYFGLPLLTLLVIGTGARLSIGQEPKPAQKPVDSQKPQNPKLGTVWINPKDGAEMVFVPAGEFEMGSKDFKNAKPVRKLFLDGYYIARTP